MGRWSRAWVGGGWGASGRLCGWMEVMLDVAGEIEWEQVAVAVRSWDGDLQWDACWCCGLRRAVCVGRGDPRCVEWRLAWAGFGEDRHVGGEDDRVLSARGRCSRWRWCWCGTWWGNSVVSAIGFDSGR